MDQIDRGFYLGWRGIERAYLWKFLYKSLAADFQTCSSDTTVINRLGIVDFNEMSALRTGAIGVSLMSKIRGEKASPLRNEIPETALESNELAGVAGWATPIGSFENGKIKTQSNKVAGEVGKE